MNLKILEGLFTIHRFPPGAGIPTGITSTPFWAVTGTTEEMSVVAPSDMALSSERQEPGWRVIHVVGPLDFSLTGILAGLAAVLAEAHVSLFAVSTFDTDYLLVKAATLDQARAALTTAGHVFVSP